MCVCVCVDVCIRMYACMYLCMYVCVGVCVCLCESKQYNESPEFIGPGNEASELVSRLFQTPRVGHVS